MNRQNENEAVGEIDIEKMKRYIAFCKSCVFLGQLDGGVANEQSMRTTIISRSIRNALLTLRLPP